MRLPCEKCESTEKLNRDMPYSLCALCLCGFVVNIFSTEFDTLPTLGLGNRIKLNLLNYEHFTN